jgi:hypothetical protein
LAWPASPHARRLPSSASAKASRAAHRGPPAGSSVSTPVTPSSTCSASPPTAAASTAARFHSASVTVSPNPSRTLFCTTTTAERCMTLTSQGS